MKPIEDNSHWMEFYQDAEEEIPRNLPSIMIPRIKMNVYLGADHAHDLFTQVSI
jgi:hypothetical protein